MFLFWMVVFAYLLVTLGMVADNHMDALCNKIVITVADSNVRHFVDRKDVMRLVRKANTPILGIPMREVETAVIEDQVCQHPFIRRTEVYTTIDGSLHVQVTQRRPILRVINRNHKGYYIDNDGYIIGFRGIYPSQVLVVNGNIPDPKSDTLGVYHVSNQEEVWKGLNDLANFINDDNLWRNQIEQVYVRKDNDVELIPRVGAHIIVLGNIQGYKEKFRKLEILYKEGFGKSDWNKYEVINLKYENQIVCTKR
jgi:cell division protein FtsQ